MYIEGKHRGNSDTFWILRFIDGEKEEFIQNASYAINEFIEEKYREELNETIIETLNKVQHNEQYDKANEQSVVISTSQITGILGHLLMLFYVTAESCKRSEEIIEKLKEIIIKYEKITAIYENNKGNDKE